MTRSIEISVEEFYHVYNRGTDKRKIFLSSRDYDRLISLLYLCNQTKPVHIDMRYVSTDSLLKMERGNSLVDIGAYCLMPNHFHLLLKEKVENGISRFMQKLTTGYTMYFNKKNNRTGSLFQGTFKARHVSDDEYLKYLFSYIHLNPVKILDSKWKEDGIKNKKEAKNFLKEYPYSSYHEYVGTKRKEGVILSPDSFPKYFEKIDDFQKMIAFWLAYKDDEKKVQ